MIINDWFYAWKVLRKYKLKYSPFTKIDKGCYNFEYLVINANPFSRNFLSIFMHEVGHHVHHKLVGDYDKWLKESYTGIRFSDNSFDVFRSLEAEGFASRFAIKTKKADRVYLNKCFNTYSETIIKNMHKLMGSYDKLISSIERNSRKINY